MDSVSSRELVQKTIRHEVTERVPKGELCFDDEVVRSLLERESSGFVGPIGFKERYHFVNWLGLDLVCLSPVYPPLTGSSSSLPRHSDCIVHDVDKWTKETSLFIFVILDGAFEWGLRIFGFHKFMIMIMKSPQLVQDFVLQVEKLNLNLVRQLADQGVNGIILADDIADRDRLMIRPETFREMFLPSMKRQVRGIVNQRLPAFFHSDGNYSVLISDIIKVGFVGLHCIDKNCGMDINALQEQYGQELCLWGHLGVEDINFLTQLVDVENLGFILGTNSGLFFGLNIHNLKKVYHRI